MIWLYFNSYHYNTAVAWSKDIRVSTDDMYFSVWNPPRFDCLLKNFLITLIYAANFTQCLSLVSSINFNNNFWLGYYMLNVPFQAYCLLDASRRLSISSDLHQTDQCWIQSLIKIFMFLSQDILFQVGSICQLSFKQPVAPVPKVQKWILWCSWLPVGD